nr:aspartate/glutamate racemase family protein [Ruegeria sp. HKCCD8929]
MHVGIIGGIGPAATELYYRGLVQAHKLAGKPLALTIVHADVSVLMTNLLAGNAQTQAEIFLEHIMQLRAGGAEEVAISALAGHFCLPHVLEHSPIPIINALNAIDRHLEQERIGRVGVLGTGPIMESKLFGGLRSTEVVVPDETDIKQVQETYAAMARSGTASESQRRYLFDVGKRLCDHDGAEAVLLAGTDLFLAFEGQAPGFTTIDCAEVHIKAIANRSLETRNQRT